MAKALQSKTEKAERARCVYCWKQLGQDAIAFQSRRHQHYLSFPHGNVLDAHLLEQYGDERVKDGGIRAILAWYYDRKGEEWQKRPQLANDAREPEDAPEPVWGDDR